MEENLRKFIALHAGDDTDRLLLGKSKWPDVDVECAVNCILSRRKLCGKVPQWYACETLLYPNTISAEQCSSAATAAYKARVCRADDYWKIADLTGGLGVDSWAFAKAGAKVLHNEMDSAIHACAKHNFAELGLTVTTDCSTPESRDADLLTPESRDADIICRNFELRPDNIDEILDGFQPDVIFLDPARRSQSGGKVFRLEDCSPNLLEVAAPLLDRCGQLVAKISPMADISLICKQLADVGVNVREVHVVGTGGECKELLLVMGQASDTEPALEQAADTEGEGNCPKAAGASEGLRLTVAECHENSGFPADTFSFHVDDEKDAAPHFADSPEALLGGTLYEPGKALMKAGAYNLLCSHGMLKLGGSTHLYLLSEAETTIRTGFRASLGINTGLGTESQSIIPLGKSFIIKEIHPLDKRSLKAVGKAYPRSEVTARNIPMTSDELRKRLAVSSGDDAHIFGVRCDFTAAPSANLLLVCERL